jgi:cytoskeletal protein CcmA (bactofilin family)
MALRPFNSIGGFSVGEGQLLAIDANLNFTGATANITGNIDAGNVAVVGLLSSASANVVGNIDAGNVAVVGSFSSSTANVTGLLGAGNIAVVGHVTAATANIAGLVEVGSLSSLGNITGTLISGSSLHISGDATIHGNLAVQGNLTYINVTDLNVEDPLISLGGGPNGAPLTTDDGMDRGVLVEYYTTEPVTGWMGWKNSTGQFEMGSNVSVANNIITVNTLGNLAVNTLLGNLSGATIATTGNASIGGNISVTHNIVAVDITATGNLVANNTSLLNLDTGNVDATGWIHAGGNLLVLGSGNIVGALDVGSVASAGNVSGTNFLGTSASVSGSVTASSAAIGGNASVTGTLSVGTGAPYQTSLSAFHAVTANSVLSANLFVSNNPIQSYEMVVRGYNSNTGNSYISTISIANNGDFSIYGTVGSSLGTFDVTSANNLTVLSVVPNTNDSIDWAVQTRTV